MSDRPSDPVDVNQARFWEHIYQGGQAGWDLGQAAPSFAALLASSESPSPGRLLVLGCGRGHDALLFARHGFAVTGVDFAPSAVAAARANAEAAGLAATFVEADAFTLADAYGGAFDYAVEHTFFCAIDPARRPEYVDLAATLLRPGGELIGLFYAHGRAGGPPYTTDADEIVRLFSGRFTIEHLMPARDSIEKRRGNELFARLRRR